MLVALARAQTAVQLGDEKPDRMQRLTQIVAGRGQETGFGEIGGFELPGALLDFAFERGVGFLKPRRHAVELIAERLELVAGLDGNPVREVAAADPRGAILQRADRDDHPAGKREPRQKRQRQRRENQNSGAVCGIVERGVGLINRQFGKDEPSGRRHLGISAQNTPAFDVDTLQRLIRANHSIASSARPAPARIATCRSCAAPR